MQSLITPNQIVLIALDQLNNRKGCVLIKNGTSSMLTWHQEVIAEGSANSLLIWAMDNHIRVNP